MAGNEVGNGGEMRTAVGRQRYEDHVRLADFGDASGGENALGIGEQDFLKQDAWIIGRRAAIVVLLVGIEDPQAQLVFGQMLRVYSKLPGRICSAKSTTGSIVVCP